MGNPTKLTRCVDECENSLTHSTFIEQLLCAKKCLGTGKRKIKIITLLPFMDMLQCTGNVLRT